MPRAEKRRVDLAAHGVPRLYFALLRRRFSGTLRLPQPRPEGTREVLFREGMPIFTDWASDRLVLGTLLVEDGTIAPSDLGRALERMAQTKAPLGAVLVELGIVDEATRYEALRRQLRAKLLETFALEEGTAEIDPTADPPDDADKLRPVNVLELVATGVRSKMPMGAVERMMAGHADRPMVFDPAFAKYRAYFRLGPEAEPVLAAISRGARYTDVAAERGASAARIFAALWACAMLRPTSAEAGNETEGRRPAAASEERTREGVRPAPRAASGVGAGSKAAGAGPPAEDDATEEGFEAALARYEALIERGAHAFELFGLPLDAKRKDVRAVWADLSRRFHPDGLAAKGLAHLRPRAEQVFAALSEANLILSDKEQRAALAASVRAGTAGGPTAASDPSATARAAIEADMLAKEADRFLAAGRFADAAKRYQEALSRTPDEPDLVAAATYAGYRARPPDPAARRQALVRLEALAAEHPKVRRIPYFAGLLYLEAKEEGKAVSSFRRALDADAGFVDAERQLRALELRKKAQEPAGRDAGGGSLFSRFRRKR